MSHIQKFILIYGIARGIKFLLGKGIIQRDLRIDNILLDEHLFPGVAKNS
jgi:serine/threonine protein kinase